MQLTSSAPTSRSAFSMAEMLIVVAVIGILAGVGYVTVSNLGNSAKEQKLKSELSVLNSAITAYQGFGGNLQDATTADDVLKKLRSVASSDLAKRVPGLSGSMVDKRLAFEFQTAKEAASDAPRVYWDDRAKRFEFARSGKVGGIGLIFVDNEAAEPEVLEDDRNFVQLYSGTDSWIWDYDEQNSAPVTGPSSVTTVAESEIEVSFPPLASATPTPSAGSKPPVPASGDGGTKPTFVGDPEEAEDLTEEPVQLLSPVFSQPGGSIPVSNFPLQVSITNPNPGGSSVLYYQVDYGDWTQLSSGNVFDVEPNQVIAAQAIGVDENWLDSSRMEQVYTATPEKLEPPVINISADSFGIFDRRVIAVVLEDANADPDIPSTLQYQINDGPWLDYNDEGYLLLDRIDFEDGASINSRAVSSDTNYLTSDLSSDGIDVDPMELASSATAEFYNPDSDRFFNYGMVTNLNYRDSANEYFEWGRVSDYQGNPYDDYSKSWLEFGATDGGNLELGSQFQIGNLDYFNGKFVADTGADSIDFGIDLGLTIGGQDVMTEFDYEFDLINTVNDDADLYGWPSADYVKIDRPSSSSTFEIDGLVFELVLEFGDATSNGFATLDEFHVREEFSATTNLYATLYDRTESQGTVDGSGQVIEVQDITEAVENEVPVNADSENSNWWEKLASWLSSFKR